MKKCIVCGLPGDSKICSACQGENEKDYFFKQWKARQDELDD